MGFATLSDLEGRSKWPPFGGGNAGIGARDQQAGRQKFVIFVGHELTENSKPLLLACTMEP